MPPLYNFIKNGAYVLVEVCTCVYMFVSFFCMYFLAISLWPIYFNFFHPCTLFCLFFLFLVLVLLIVAGIVVIVFVSSSFIIYLLIPSRSMSAGCRKSWNAFWNDKSCMGRRWSWRYILLRCETDGTHDDISWIVSSYGKACWALFSDLLALRAVYDQLQHNAKIWLFWDFLFSL